MLSNSTKHTAKYCNVALLFTSTTISSTVAADYLKNDCYVCTYQTMRTYMHFVFTTESRSTIIISYPCTSVYQSKDSSLFTVHKDVDDIWSEYTKTHDAFFTEELCSMNNIQQSLRAVTSDTLNEYAHHTRGSYFAPNKQLTEVVTVTSPCSVMGGPQIF